MYTKNSLRWSPAVAGSSGAAAVAASAWVERTTGAYVDGFGATVPPPGMTA